MKHLPTFESFLNESINDFRNLSKREQIDAIQQFLEKLKIDKTDVEISSDFVNFLIYEDDVNLKEVSDKISDKFGITTFVSKYKNEACIAWKKV